MDNNDEIMRALGRIEGKLTAMADHADRIRAVENKQAWYSGAALVGALVAGRIMETIGWTA